MVQIVNFDKLAYKLALYYPYYKWDCFQVILIRPYKLDRSVEFFIHDFAVICVKELTFDKLATIYAFKIQAR